MSQMLFDFLDRLRDQPSDTSAGWTFIGFARDLGLDGAHIWFARGTRGEPGFRESETSTYHPEGLKEMHHEVRFENRRIPRIVARGGPPFRAGWDIDRQIYGQGTEDHRVSQICLDYDRRRNALVIPVPTAGQFGTSGVSVYADVGCESFDELMAERGAAVVHAAMATHVAMQKRGQTQALRTPALSPRERECVLWLAQGNRTKEIARRLNLSPSAVALYLANARRKLRADNREQLVAKAYLTGLLN